LIVGAPEALRLSSSPPAAEVEEVDVDDKPVEEVVEDFVFAGLPLNDPMMRSKITPPEVMRNHRLRYRGVAGLAVGASGMRLRILHRALGVRGRKARRTTEHPAADYFCHHSSEGTGG
jgi:hypothetical protein